MMFDCWKKSCHGATVVPTIAMISSTAVEPAPPWILGNEGVFDDVADVRVGEHQQRDDEEVRDHEHVHEALPAAEAARRGDRDQRERGDGTATYLLTPK